MSRHASTAGAARRRRRGTMVTLVVTALMMATLTPTAQAIVGGREATPGANPYMAALVPASNPDAFQGRFCGATVIAPEWVMTAGHCVLDATPAEVDVVISRHDLTLEEGERIRAQSIVVHPAYTKKRSYDVALIKLEAPTSATPVGLATSANAHLWTPGTPATVKGWGNTQSVPRLPTNLREVDLPITSDADCAGPQGAKFVAGTMICAGEIPNDGTGPCQGDSGGPLVVPDGGGGVIQVGIVSWGGCDVPLAPAVFSEVAVFDGWIAATMSAPPDDPPTDPPTDPPPGGQELLVSTSSDRSNPVPLEDAFVSGNVFVFLSPPNGVDIVTFTVPGYGEKTDSAAPFDALGTGPEGNAKPLRTDRMPAGVNTLSSHVVFEDGSTATVAATFTNGAPPTTTTPPDTTTTTTPPGSTTTTVPPDTTTTVPPTTGHALLVSLSTDRSDPSPLDDATVTTNTFFVFLSPDAGVGQVSFDVPGYGTKTDTAAPFDAAGTGPQGNALPLRSSRMPSGSNTIVALVTFSDGSTATTTATFTLP